MWMFTIFGFELYMSDVALLIILLF